jgi:hypothetical protein
MTSLAGSTSVTSDSRAHWITPEEQLKKFASPLVVDAVSNAAGLQIEGINKLIATYAMEEAPIWYTACKRLKVFPEKIPPLPDNIQTLLEPFKDTHFLALICEEFGNLNKFESNILKPYWEKEHPKEENPLKFKYYDKTLAEHGGKPFPATHWILMPKDVLPESRNKTWTQQVALVKALSEKSGIEYQIPNLQQVLTAIMIYKVATGISLYPPCTRTRVIEQKETFQLEVGSYDQSHGVGVFRPFGFHWQRLGVSALPQLESLVLAAKNQKGK